MHGISQCGMMLTIRVYARPAYVYFMAPKNVEIKFDEIISHIRSMPFDFERKQSWCSAERITAFNILMSIWKIVRHLNIDRCLNGICPLNTYTCERNIICYDGFDPNCYRSNCDCSSLVGPFVCDWDLHSLIHIRFARLGFPQVQTDEGKHISAQSLFN